jgi:hypothetical protein
MEWQPFKKKPYLLIAKKGNERSYLKLDEGSSLSLAKFDISGAEVKNGIKGFILVNVCLKCMIVCLLDLL